MPDTAGILADPKVVDAVFALILESNLNSGVASAHANRIALNVKSRLEAGGKIDELITLANLFRSAALTEAAELVNGARQWAEGDLRGPRDVLRRMAKDPTYKPEPPEDD